MSLAFGFFWGCIYLFERQFSWRWVWERQRSSLPLFPLQMVTAATDRPVWSQELKFSPSLPHGYRHLGQKGSRQDSNPHPYRMLTLLVESLPAIPHSWPHHLNFFFQSIFVYLSRFYRFIKPIEWDFSLWKIIVTSEGINELCFHLVKVEMPLAPTSSKLESSQLWFVAPN